MAEQPAASEPQSRNRDRGPIIGGLVLIVIGVLLLIAQNMQDVGKYIPLGIGLVLLIGFLLTRAYGLLVPGGIVTGVGVGILVVTNTTGPTDGGYFLLSLGAGFILVWLLGGLFRAAEHHWWPLIPGGILITIGALTVAGQETSRFIDYWPVILVVIGVIVVAQALTQRRRT